MAFRRSTLLLKQILHHEIIPSKVSSNAKTVVFLHGLLGSGKNLKTLAKKLQDQHPAISPLLLDLRGHGQSPGMEQIKQTTNLRDCAKDVISTLRHLNLVNQDSPIGIVGHSFGGRVALEYMDELSFSQEAEGVKKVVTPLSCWILDSVPGRAHGSVADVIEAVSSIQLPIDSKRDLIDRLQRMGIQKDIGAWMTTNLKPHENAAGKFDFTFDLSVVTDILDDFPRQNFLPILKGVAAKLKERKVLNPNLPPSKINLVRAGRNKSWTEDLLTDLSQIEQSYESSFQLHTLENAGHWVHVDDLPGLIKIMT